MAQVAKNSKVESLSAKALKGPDAEFYRELRRRLGRRMDRKMDKKLDKKLDEKVHRKIDRLWLETITFEYVDDSPKGGP